LAPTDSSASPGAETLSLGHPNGLQMHASPGKLRDTIRVSAFKVETEESPDTEWLTLNSRTEPGNSGSPVFDLRTGQVIGIHVRGTAQKETSYAVKPDFLRRLLTPSPQERAARLSRLSADRRGTDHGPDAPAQMSGLLMEKHGDVQSLRSAAEVNFFKDRPQALSNFNSLDPAARERFGNILSHLEAQSAGSSRSVSDQKEFLEKWILSAPADRPSARSLALFEQSLRRLTVNGIDLTTVFQNSNKQIVE